MRGLLAGVFVVAGCRIGFDAPPDALPGDAPPADYCARVPGLADPPAIDGALEAGLVLQTLVPVGWDSSVLPLPPVPDVPVRFAAGYRPDGVYFFVDVSDPDRFPAPSTELSYCGDGVEIYVDHDGVFTEAPSFDSAGSMQFIARAPATATEPSADGADRW